MHPIPLKFFSWLWCLTKFLPLFKQLLKRIQCLFFNEHYYYHDFVFVACVVVA